MGVTIPGPSGEVKESYEISNSLRFNDGDSAYLSRANSSGGSRKIFTFSCWFKKSTLGSASDDQMIFSSYDGSNGIFIQIDANDLLQVYSKVGGTVKLNVRSEMVFRDVSAWYHIVVKFDSNNTNLDLYVNGVEISQTVVVAFTDADHEINESGGTHYIGTKPSDRLWDGYITEVHFIDGTAKAQTDFGEFDDNGVWIPKRYTGGNYGTNGFHLEFKQTGTSQNSSGIGADTSGNDNHFAVTNLAATDVTEDTCTNNFATMNPLESDRQQGGAATFAEGNLQITTSYVDANYQRYPQVYSTQAVSSGKWYFEMKITTSDTDSFIGVHSPDNYASDSTTNPYGGYASTGAIYTSRGSVRINDGQTTGHGTFSQNDIVGCALDLDNNKVYFHKNGTYVQSGDPAGNSGGQAIPSGFTYGFTVGADAASDSGIMQVNFGNPIHTISSGNTDGKYGNFEYAVPSGFYAVCTKRLAEFG